MSQQPGIAVAVVMERIAAPNAWEAGQFRVVEVVPGDGVFGSTPRKLHDDGKTSRWLHPGFRVELFSDECKGYFLNPSSGRPSWFVSWRDDDGDPSRVEITAVSLSCIEADRRLTAEVRVEKLPLEPELCEWLRLFANEHFRPDTGRKVRAQSFLSPEERARQIGQAADQKPGDAEPAGAPAPATAPAPAVQVPTLDDVAALEPGADCTAFTAPAVDAGVRNAALRKLVHTDPHFSASDGLDVSADEAAARSEGPLAAGAPRLTQARCELLREICIVDEYGDKRSIHIPAERPLTVFVDKCELVTLMTLGERPELLVLGYLRNQRLIADVSEVESVTVDWDVGAAAVRTHAGVRDMKAKTAHRIVTTGCGQGTVFGDVMSQIDSVVLPDAKTARIRQTTLHRMLETMRQQDSIHRKAGSVHGCALFRGPELLCFVEDVGRHNAIDTIAGWMAMHDVGGGDKAFYTTGRLTSEMVMKAAQLGVPIIVSRNGVTAMGHELASRLGMTLFGRAANRHFLCYTGTERFDSEPEPQRAPVRRVAG